MKDFVDAEKRIKAYMSVGTRFVFNNKQYEIILSGKPKCAKGEPKTDIYIRAKSSTNGKEIIEIKISYKKENASFLENRINANRAHQLFGDDWERIIVNSIQKIQDELLARRLVHDTAAKNTEAGAITLGWRLDLVRNDDGDLSGEIQVDKEQLSRLMLDAYAGVNLSKQKKDATVNDKTIIDSGVADYILVDDTIKSAQDVIDKMIPIKQYVNCNSKIYFACKALNLRSYSGTLRGKFSGKFCGKLDGKAKGIYEKKIKTERIKRYASEEAIDCCGKFDGIITGDIDGKAKGTFDGDMKGVKLIFAKIPRDGTQGYFKPAWDSDRPLAVYVDWSIENNKLKSELVFDKPFMVTGNYAAKKLINCMNQLHITNVRDIDDKNKEYAGKISDGGALNCRPLIIVSLFTGCGGLEFGFKKAGFNIRAANVADDVTWETFETNFPECHLINKDMKNVTGEELRSSIKSDVDGIICGLPYHSWGFESARCVVATERRSPIFDYLRMIKELKPKFFLAESTVHWYASGKDDILNNCRLLLSETDYSIKHAFVNAMDYGVAEDRKSIFFVGFRKDLHIEFDFPKGSTECDEKKVTLGMVISDLQDTAIPAGPHNYHKHNAINNNEYFQGPFSSIYMSWNRVRSWNEQAFKIQSQGKMTSLHPQAPKMVKVNKYEYRFVENNENLYRRLSVREAARIQGFPDDFQLFYYKLNDAYRMIGNAVPVNLAYEVAVAIKDALESND
ncbi:MAG: DNA (cytosine-5-)-methyltransferase [Oceanobacillus sp.]|nr:DNA (cytosine-5-)-methyltransferase [Oceanobacillus sp.]